MVDQFVLRRVDIDFSEADMAPVRGFLAQVAHIHWDGVYFLFESESDRESLRSLVTNTGDINRLLITNVEICESHILLRPVADPADRLLKELVELCLCLWSCKLTQGSGNSVLPDALVSRKST